MSGDLCDRKLIIPLVLAGSLGFLAALNAGALVVLLLAQVSQNSGLRAGALEALQSSIQRLVFLDMDFRHSISLPPQAPKRFGRSNFRLLTWVL